MFSQTYIRQDEDANLEILGYGAGNQDKSDSFQLVERDDSTFKLQVQELESAYGLLVWAAVEHIPADWTQVNVALYHVYHDSFDMEGAQFTIKVATQKQVLEEKTGLIGHTEVYTADFPLDDAKETEKLIREQVATITVPDNIQGSSYCLIFEVVASGDDYKRGWSFEGVGITKHV